MVNGANEIFHLPSADITWCNQGNWKAAVIPQFSCCYSRKSAEGSLVEAAFSMRRRVLTTTCVRVIFQAVATLGPHRGKADSDGSVFPFRPDRNRSILNCWGTHTHAHTDAHQDSNHMRDTYAYDTLLRTWEHTAERPSDFSHNPLHLSVTPVGKLPPVPADIR